MVNHEHVRRAGITVMAENPGALYNFLYGQVPFLTSPVDSSALMQESLLTGTIDIHDIRLENVLLSESVSDTSLGGAGFESEKTDLCLTRNEDGIPEVSVNTVLHRSDRSVTEFPHFTIPMVQNIASRLEKKQIPSVLRFTGISSKLQLTGEHPKEMRVQFESPGFVDPNAFDVVDTYFFSTRVGKRVLDRAYRQMSNGVTSISMTGSFTFGSEQQFVQDISGYASSYEKLLAEIYTEIGEMQPSVNITLRSAHNLLTRLVLE